MKYTTVIVTLLILCLGGATLEATQTKIETDPAKVDMAKRTKELQELRFGMFICWSFSTFSGCEWTPGVEDINFFAPSGFEPEQWVLTAKAAGMKYVLFLTKHHDGFCLWDTKTTDRKVGNTKFLPGVDVLAEVRKACDKHGIKLAIYFSEGDWSWDPENKFVQRPGKPRPETKKAQLKELLTNYGPIEFLWFDHVAGTGGLDHAETVKFCKTLQPGCFVGFNNGTAAGDIWLRERGTPGELGDPKATNQHFKWVEKSKHKGFRLAEFTYPILEGPGDGRKLRGARWFYSLPENDNFVKSAEAIYKDYLGAKKYGNIFSLDVGPDRSGKLRKIDVATLKKVGQYIRGEIKLPKSSKPAGRTKNPKPAVSAKKSITASGVWKNGKQYDASKANDGDPKTRWGGDKPGPGWLEVDLGKVTEISQMSVFEFAPRVKQFKLLTRNTEADEWRVVISGKGLGKKFAETFKPVKGRYFRLDISLCTGVPSICEWQLR
jgi:alpha-L-fucosidase